MASPKRHADDLLAIAPKLREVASTLGFFPLVAFLERLTAGARPLGGEGPAAEEGVRFRHDPSLGFSAGDVSAVDLQEVAVRPSDPGSPTRPVFQVTTTFLGLTGSVTPLPLYIPEEIARETAEDPERAVRRDFLDVFHHRLLSLFYRIRARYDLASGFSSGAEDRWSKRLLSMGGITGEEKLSGIPSWRLLRLSPLLATRARTARGLEVFLQDVLERELGTGQIQVKEFEGSWAELDVAQRTRLSRVNHQLGRSMVLGSRVFFRGGGFVIRAGPLDERTYRRFLPDGDLLPVVKEAVDVYLPDPLEFRMELVLAKEVATGFRLSRAAPARLGRDTFLAGRAGKEKELKVRARR